MKIRHRFKKFGGEFIPDIVEYIKDYVSKFPNVTISVGCDSVQRKRKTTFAITVMLYNMDIRNGAHIVFYRENITKLRSDFERLNKEAQYVLEVGDFLQEELKPLYQRKDLNPFERKRYKYHVEKCEGGYSHVSRYDEDSVIRSLPLTEYDKSCEFNLIDLHVDFNPNEGLLDKKGNPKNRSNAAYKSYVPWLRSLGYRVWAKPLSHAASSAADLLLQD